MIFNGLENVLKATKGKNPSSFTFTKDDNRHLFVMKLQTGETIKIPVDSLFSEENLNLITDTISPEENIQLLDMLKEVDIPEELIELYGKGES